MPKLGIQDLAAVLAQKKGLTKAQAESFVGAMFDVVNYGLDTERLVKVKGFGTFKVTNVKDRESINVNTGERVVISGHGKVGFTPEAVLRDMVNKPFAQFETVVLNEGVDFSQIDDPQEESSETEQVIESKPEEDVAVQSDSTTVKVQLPENDDKDEHKETEESKEASIEDHEEEETPDIVVETKATETGNCISSSAIASDSDKPESVSSKVDDLVPCETQDEDSQMQEDGDNSSASEESASEDPSASSVWKWVAVCAAFLLFAATAGFVGYYFGTQQSSSVSKATPTVAPKPKNVESKKRVAVKAQEVKSDSVAKQKEVGVSTTAKSDVERNASMPSEISTKANQTTSPSVRPPLPDTQNLGVVTALKYDKMDVRVRTGAYAIVGVSKVVTVKEGETLKGISDRNLGTGMECYVEVLNGTRTVKAGDKIKIPQLVLKKRLKK